MANLEFGREYFSWQPAASTVEHPGLRPLDANGGVVIETSRMRPLSERPQELLGLVTQGLPRRQALAAAHLTQSGATRCFDTILDCLDARTGPEAMRVALETGIITVESKAAEPRLTPAQRRAVDLTSRGLAPKEVASIGGVGQMVVNSLISRARERRGYEVSPRAYASSAALVHRCYQNGDFGPVHDPAARLRQLHRMWRLRGFLAAAYRIPQPAEWPDSYVAPLLKTLPQLIGAIFQAGQMTTDFLKWIDQPVPTPRDGRVKRTEEKPLFVELLQEHVRRLHQTPADFKVFADKL